jgi:hypothetical protein
MRTLPSDQEHSIPYFPLWIMKVIQYLRRGAIHDRPSTAP